jgi:hypothetical protein
MFLWTIRKMIYHIFCFIGTFALPTTSDKGNPIPAKAGTGVSSADPKAVSSQALQIDSRTLKRWRRWWLDNFVRSSFWKAARARFMPPVCEQTLPWSLWLSFELEERDRLLAVLQFLSPMTTPAAWKELAM